MESERRAVSDAELAITHSSRLEHILKTEFGAEGEGLGAQARSVQRKLSMTVVRGLLDVARIRNQVVHELVTIPAPEQFTLTCTELERDLYYEALLVARSTSSASPSEPPPPPPTSNSEATIDQIWWTADPEYSIGHMTIHVKFSIQGAQGVPCEATAYFYDSSGRPLKDINSQYYGPGGVVAAHEAFTPPYDPTVFHDLVLSLPRSELHLSWGRRDVLFDVAIYDTIKGSDIIRSEKQKAKVPRRLLL